MAENPYESPRNENKGAESLDSFGRLKKQKRTRTFLLALSLSWLAFMLFTGTCADNIRYMPSHARFNTYAAIIVFGNCACLVCLCFAVRGWWHLLAAPIWLICLSELFIASIYLAAAAGLIHPKPWSERNLPASSAAPPGLPNLDFT